MFRKNKKKKQITLEDLKIEFEKNYKYRYAICVGKNKIPICAYETLDDAEDDIEFHIICDAPLPVVIVDLAYWQKGVVFGWYSCIENRL